MKLNMQLVEEEAARLRARPGRGRKIGSGKPLGPNVPEQRLRKKLENAGYRVSKKGWPDFIVFGPDGKFKGVVEVKPTAREDLSEDQKLVMQGLAEYGVPTYRWDPWNGGKRLIRNDDSPDFSRIPGPQSLRKALETKI